MKLKALLLFLILIALAAFALNCGDVYPTGSVVGWVYDAVATTGEGTATPLYDGVEVTLTYSEGAALADNSGPYILYPSSVDGEFGINDIEAGSYTVEVTVPSTYIGITGETIIVTADKTNYIAPYAIPDIKGDNTIRAVLTWAPIDEGGSLSNTDLDLHVTYPLVNYGEADGERAMEYWYVRAQRETGELPPVSLDTQPVVLDLDMTGTGAKGPETASFNFSQAVAPNGIYRIDVYCYDDKGAATTADAELLGKSNATVRFCDDYDGCWLSTTVTYNTLGNLWQVGYFWFDTAYMDDGAAYLYSYDMEYLVGADEDTITSFNLLGIE